MHDIAQHADAALAHLSNALDDLQYSPDQRPVPLINEAMAGLRSILRAAPRAEVAPFQQRVQPWLLECFGQEISGDLVERGDRFLEEVLEFLQAHGYDRTRIPALVDYVYSREAGEPTQEAGGVMVTFAAYCSAARIDMHVAGDVELLRVWTKIPQIREKQASKAGIHSPLPGGAA